MSDLNLQLKNKARIMRAFKEAPAEMVKMIQTAIQQTGGMTVGYVKTNIVRGTGMYKPPFDTGTMSRGIQVREIQPLRVTITTASATPYALFVHEGTRKMKARPFFEITKDVDGKKIQDFFADRLNKFTNDFAKRIG